MKAIWYWIINSFRPNLGKLIKIDNKTRMALGEDCPETRKPIVEELIYRGYTSPDNSFKAFGRFWWFNLENGKIHSWDGQGKVPCH